MCADTGTQHLIIGSYTDPEGTNNLLKGYIFDSSTSTTIVIPSADLGAHVIQNIVVYNTATISYLALLTTANDNYYLRLGTCTDVGAGSAFTLSSTVMQLTNPTAKIQWCLGNDGTPYLATDMQETLNIFAAHLDTLSLTLHATTTNVAGSSSATFLYWAFQTNGLYLVQGYGASSIATYKVSADTGLFTSTGVTTDISDLFAVSRACSTCADYLAIGGTGNADHARLARYSINTDGTLEHLTSATLPGTAVQYCERCCCNDNDLIVATDSGLYTIDPGTLALIASNTEMSDNNWVNACWCCSESVLYSSAINSSHQSYIFEVSGSTLQAVMQL
jgi:hypothetical protein